MSTLYAIWVIGTFAVALGAAVGWAASWDLGDDDKRVWCARVLLLCWAWPIGVLCLLPYLIRDALDY